MVAFPHTLMALWASMAVAEPAAPVDPESVDWAAVGIETAEFLSDYLQVDTINPPGNELRGAHFLASWLGQWGIESTIQEYAPGRANLRRNGCAAHLLAPSHRRGALRSRALGRAAHVGHD